MDDFRIPDLPNSRTKEIDSLWNTIAELKANGSLKCPHAASVGPGLSAPHDPNPAPSPSHPATTDASSALSSTNDELLGLENDHLIPSTLAIARVFSDGYEYWSKLLQRAQTFALGGLSFKSTNPSIMLEHMPCLPHSLPVATSVCGRPVWHIRGGEDQHTQEKCGLQKSLRLLYKDPVIFWVTGASKSKNSRSGHMRGFWLLTLCWSYILSKRLLEMQSRPVRYTQAFLIPQIVGAGTLRQGDIAVHLGANPNPKLSRWICALLAPKLGWESEDGLALPPWAGYCAGDAHFVVTTEDEVAISLDASPPDHIEATELLIELCNMYGLASHGSDGVMEPYIAGFLAALAVPFYRCEGLKPHFYVSSLQPVRMPTWPYAQLRSIVADLHYHMTLSLLPLSVGSVIWSIFWQPGIECNLVSPWLSSILSVLQPFLEAKDKDTIIAVFSMRRPRVALWWHGIFCLGSLDVFDWILRYLNSLEERDGYGSLSPPDLTAAAWTGSPQSFLEESTPGHGFSIEGTLSRADLLRIRYNFHLGDRAMTPLAWKPFGAVPQEAVEPELFAWIRTGCAREYSHWLWTTGKKLRTEIKDAGYRRHQRRVSVLPPDDVRVGRTSPRSPEHRISLAPSKRATIRMVSLCIQDVAGDRHLDNAGMPGLSRHPWLIGWRG